MTQSHALVDPAPCLTPLAVMVNALCKTVLSPEGHAGPQMVLSRRTGGTVAMEGHGEGGGRARRLDRAAPRHVRAALPPLSTRAQCTRQVRQPSAARGALARPLVPLVAAQCSALRVQAAGLRRSLEGQALRSGWDGDGGVALTGT